MHFTPFSPPPPTSASTIPSHTTDPPRCHYGTQFCGAHGSPPAPPNLFPGPRLPGRVRCLNVTLIACWLVVILNRRAQEVSARLSKYEDCFVDAMMTEELGLPSYAEPLEEGASIREGLVTFASFAISGVLPLLVYVLSPVISSYRGGPVSQGNLFLWASVITATALFIIGVVKVRRPAVIHQSYRVSATQSRPYIATSSEF